MWDGRKGRGLEWWEFIWRIEKKNERKKWGRDGEGKIIWKKNWEDEIFSGWKDEFRKIVYGRRRRKYSEE